MQVEGSVSPWPALTLTSLSIDVAPGQLHANASGLVSGAQVSAQLSSVLQTQGNSSVRVGSIRVTSSSGASLDALLASQASAVSSDVGITLPQQPAAAASTAGESAAELVFDSQHGLRMVNISISGSKIGISDLARLVGFSWNVDAGSDPISFSAPWLYYVPSKPNATNITWAGRQLVGPELGVAATVDVPALGINATRGMLLVQGPGNVSLLVSR